MWSKKYVSEIIYFIILLYYFNLQAVSNWSSLFFCREGYVQFEDNTHDLLCKPLTGMLTTQICDSLKAESMFHVVKLNQSGDSWPSYAIGVLLI